MCLVIHNRKTGQDIESPPQLRAFLGVDTLPPAEGYEDGIDDGSCLCQVDVDVALVGAGIEFEDEWGMTYYIDK